MRPLGTIVAEKDISATALIVMITAIKMIGLFLVPQSLQALLSPIYGVAFTDNYNLLGKSLADGLGYRFTADTAPTLMREPGYPFVLAVLFKLFGYGLTAPRIANLAFDVVSALLIARVARRACNDSLVEKIAPVLFLVHPGIMIADMRGGVESIFIMLTMAFLTLTLRLLETNRLENAVMAGLALGLASLVRSTALLFPVMYFLYSIIWLRKKYSIQALATRSSVMLICAIATMSPWIIRNYAVSGELVVTASVAGVSANAGQYICKHLTFDNSLRNVDWAAAEQRLSLAKHLGYRFKEVEEQYYLYFYDTDDEIAFNRRLGQEAIRNYLDSPALLLECGAKNFFNFWFAGKTWASTVLNSMAQLPYLALGMFGLVIGLRKPQAPYIAFFSSYIAYTLCVYLPILAEARYSIPLIPIISILAALPLAERIRASTASNEQL